MDLISVVVPIYDVEEYLPKCIESIINQTYKNLEIILVDDGSPDNCGKICEEYAKKDNRIKIIRKENGGLADARNAGINIAKGKYIGFVDSDDYIEEEMIEILYFACIRNDVKIACCGRYDIYNGEKVSNFTLEKETIMNSEEALGNLLLWRSLDSSACDKLFKKDLFDGIRYPIGKISEDVAVTYLLLESAETIVHVGKPLYNYIHHNNSITTKRFSHKNMDLYFIVSELHEYLNKKYKNLRNQSDYFYFIELNYLLTKMITSDDKHQFILEIKEIKNKLKINTYRILMNEFLSKSEKKSILAYTYLFDNEIVFWIYKLLRKVLKGCVN